MRVALINPPSVKNYIRTGRWTRASRAAQNWYPIILAYAAGALEQRGHTCLLLDCCAENLDAEQTLEKIKNFKPNLSVIYFGYETWREDTVFAEKIAGKVVLASPWSDCLPDLLKNTSLRCMTNGEFEQTLLEVATEKDLSEISGLTWKNEKNEVIKNAARPLMAGSDLDKLPFVTQIYKHHLNFKKYRQTSLKYPFVDTLASRGCSWGKCTYCHSWWGSHQYRERSLSDVMEELWYIKNNLLEVKQVYFQDDLLTEERMLKISEEILSENLDICWGAETRPTVSYEVLKKARESGLRTLQVGYEVPNQKYLNLIQKGTTVDQLTQFAMSIEELKIWTSMSLMIFPTMTSREIKFMVKWAKKMNPTRINLMMALPYPGTQYSSEKLDAEAMTTEEMTKWEKWGFKEFYIKNPRFWWNVAKNPREWRNVLSDAQGLLNFLSLSAPQD